MTNFNIPILFLVFNRLDTTQQVFTAIQQIKPTKLYLACDGPREDKPGETQIVNELRQYLLNNINWQCSVQTLFRTTNLGCGKAVSQAITWFFKHEPMGIILEDDCLPSASFFTFCEEMLLKYKDDTRIWHISGYSLLTDNNLTYPSYYFSQITQIWGWASWANRWQEFDLMMKKYPQFIKYKYMNKIFPSLRLRLWHKELFDKNYAKTDTWDCQWYFTSLINNGLSITPRISLIKNLGFGDLNSAHPDVDSLISSIDRHQLHFPLTHPHIFCINPQLDNIYFKWRTRRGVYLKLLAYPIIKIDNQWFRGKMLKLYKKLRNRI
ncbi:MAG: hypothetical protein KBD37_00930 [Burkholderiales bacterium]|nr:hypothetical protein [Burkholderiales bacterium]